MIGSIIVCCKEIEWEDHEILTLDNVEEIKETLKEHQYSDKNVSEILKPSLNNWQVSEEEDGYGRWIDVIQCILEKMVGGSEKAYVLHQCNLTEVKFIWISF